ncbi:MAG: hypothetical protein JWN41_354 [Thermoleophilia bacterium]|nr:hypothetical protein [Thermoleophilia bacterium]
MTSPSTPLTHALSESDLRAALVTTSLCVSAGVHAALAAMHAGGASMAEFAIFELGAVAALVAISLFGNHARAGAVAAIVTLSALSMTYALSRLFELPVVGRQAIDLLGLTTVAIQLMGAVLAYSLLRSRAQARPAPILICVLIVAYSLLASYAIPSVHHGAHMHHSGHSHAS